MVKTQVCKQYVSNGMGNYYNEEATFCNLEVILFVLNPLLQYILFRWKPGRASIIPLLTHNRMRELFPLMKEVLTRLDEHIIENSSKEFEVYLANNNIKLGYTAISEIV